MKKKILSEVFAVMHEIASDKLYELHGFSDICAFSTEKKAKDYIKSLSRRGEIEHDLNEKRIKIGYDQEGNYEAYDPNNRSGNHHRIFWVKGQIPDRELADQETGTKYVHYIADINYEDGKYTLDDIQFFLTLEAAKKYESKVVRKAKKKDKDKYDEINYRKGKGVLRSSYWTRSKESKDKHLISRNSVKINTSPLFHESI